MVLSYYSGISCAPQTRKRSAAQKQCTQQSVYENCIQPLFSKGDPHRHLPNTTEQITAICGRLNQIDTCVKEYSNKCLTPTEQKATQAAIGGIAQLSKRMCSSPTAKQGIHHYQCLDLKQILILLFWCLEFVRNSKCGNAVIGDMKSCLNGYKMALYGAKQVKVTERLPILCWYDI